ncbi:MAG TPA: glycosyltransferase [Tepidisphaeraceae bacterium]|nr:glycosyltransferase [Tepidisphaeraceae bacterium]
MVLLIASILWALAIAVLLIRAVRQYSFYQIVEPVEGDGTAGASVARRDKIGEGSLIPSPGTPGEGKGGGRAPVPAPSPALPRHTGGGREESPPIGSCTASVAVIIPARNEEQNIGRCLQGLLAQQSPPEIRSIIVIDDCSTDATGRIAREVAQRNPIVHLVEGKPLEAGWAGKPHALCQGAQAAQAIFNDVDENQWLCLTDADTAAEPALLRTAVSVAQSRSLDLLSLQPEQELIGSWERLIMPCGFFLVAFTQDVRQANDPNDPNAHANGQFMLIRRQRYEVVGGYEKLRAEVWEDSAMARLVKASGGGVGVVGTKNLIHARMYRDFSSLWYGLSRQAAALLGTAIGCIIAALSALILACASLLLPIASVVTLAERGANAITIGAAACGFAGSLALLGTHLGAARYFKIPMWYGALFPLGYLMGAGIAIHAAVSRMRNTLVWKGRVVEAIPGANLQASGTDGAAELSRRDVGAL